MEVGTPNTDDEYLTWNVTACSDNADGVGQQYDFANYPFRCCY